MQSKVHHDLLALWHGSDMCPVAALSRPLLQKSVDDAVADFPRYGQSLEATFEALFKASSSVLLVSRDAQRLATWTAVPGAAPASMRVPSPTRV